MATKEATIESMSEIIAIAEAHRIDDHVAGWFFRGQSDSNWDLIPKAHRCPYKGRENFEFKFKMWRKSAQTYPGVHYSNEFEAMAIAQHHV